MRLGLHLGYWGAAPPDGAAAVAAARRLGLDSVWTAEAYGSDALTPLAWWGAGADGLRLGTAIAQISARTPTATAMAALTLDHLCGGRFVLGLGVSGPQVVEGWYGEPFDHPLARTREYVDVVRQVLARRGPVAAAGPHYPLPRPGGTGLGKPLTSTVHPRRADLPIHLAAQGPRNVALAAEIADGWLPAFFAPAADATYRAALAEGFARRSPERSPVAGFEVNATVSVAVDDDVEAAADRLRPQVALYLGGMGAAGTNFHRDMVDRLGWAEATASVAQLWAEGRRAEAIAAVPTDLVRELAFIGPPGAVRERWAAWRETVVTGLLLQGAPGDVARFVAAVS